VSAGESILSKYTLEGRSKHGIDYKVNTPKIERAKFVLKDAKKQVRLLAHKAKRKPVAFKAANEQVFNMNEFNNQHNNGDEDDEEDDEEDENDEEK
jgi:hypothetical protein